MLRIPVAGSAADDRRNVRDQLVVPGVELLHYADEPFATDDVDALPRGVEIHIVGLADNPRDPRDLATAFGVEHNQIGPLARRRVEPLVGLVQSHRVIAIRALDQPLRHLAGVALDGLDDLTRIRAVHEHAIPLGLDLKRFGMAAGLDHRVLEELIRRGIDRADAAILLSISDENPLVARVPAQVVGLASEVDRLLQRVAARIKDQYLAVGAGAHDLVEAGNIQHALRFRGRLEGVDQPALEPVLDTHGVAADYREQDQSAVS